ncbi:hypothetical protein [Microbulbifer hydrolyticus]|uniref:Uncharacterized protein n=1 Tax=Microbulbifer hydrolyticus TaxID=48074 RepID=A0A6P1TEW6_9GAMM|nr:hypothetical protein [Microbulbifer hydrolyticus]MBB5212557.1 hypothetical protein [Microbulbifer hydrolyticus]QHQ40175.1 hypothetical protein GTQ55_15100 [Microbulbifer hydrolyticus]
MKAIALIFLMLLTSLANALTCSNYEPLNNEKIVLETEHGVTNFSVPEKLEGNSLESVTLWAYPKTKGVSGELAAPLAFKVDGGFAKGQFAITAPFLEAAVTAAYSKELCGPRLEARVSI